MNMRVTLGNFACELLKIVVLFSHYLFHDGDPYHVETSPLICRTNQWAGFYMIRDLRHKTVKRSKVILNYAVTENSL